MRMSSRFQSYLMAVAAVALCSWASIFFRPLSSEAPFLFFLPVVLFSLWMGGFRVGLFATLLSALALDFFVYTPYTLTLRSRDLEKEALFVATMVAALWIFERQRKRSEKSLRLQHKLIEAAVESVMISDAEHHLIYWNRGAEKLYGWAEHEAIGKSPGILLGSEYPEPLENIRHQLKESGRWHGRLVRRSKNGNTVITESAWALDAQTGDVLQTDLDVTKHSLAEYELKRANRALGALSKIKQILIHPPEGDKLLQQAVEIMVQEGRYPIAWIGIPENDPERSIRLAASAGKDVDYLSTVKLTWKDEPSGRGPSGTAIREGRICVVQNSLTDPNCAPWREMAARQGFRSAICLPLIVQGQTVAGLTLYAEEENTFAGQELDLVCELASDLAFGLTTIRLREQAAENRASRLILEEQFRQAQKMEAIGRLAGGISHDFNNLLMVIMAQTELLSRQLTGSALGRAESITRSAERAADLTRQLLAFSRKQIVQPKVLSMNGILVDIAKMAGHLLGENIEVVTVLCDQPWMVQIDRSQFEQVIMNLIVNARDAMPGGGTLKLETANTDIGTEYIATHPQVSPGKYVMLAVSDTGEGMDAETQARLFEPFFTTKEVGRGTGLGLSVVYGIVKQSNGFIYCESEPGKGTSFKIFLPIAEMSATAEELSAPVETAPKIDHATILLVEDEFALREVISEFLSSAGHTVIAAESPTEAMKHAEERGSTIDLLVTDVILKGVDGKRLAQDLRGKGFNFKVIYMSGHAPSAIIHHGMLAPGTMFLQKPFTRSAVLNKIQEALAR
jgi:PAS domain S-box-containing protein